MNERIRELAGQAGAGINYTDNGEPFDVHFNKYETFEKFAELIVEECCKSFQGYTFEEIAVKTLKATFRS